MSFKSTITYILCFLFTTPVFSQGNSLIPSARRTLIVMFDGLRPDYITADYMPNLNKLKKEGVYASNNHSVFPTVTRVNSASYATGSYPQRHGLLGNSVYFPQVESKSLNTGEAENLMKIEEATGGHLLQSISLGEVLHAKGKQLMVFSSGSSGQAFLQNHKVNGGAVINTELILPLSLKDEIHARLGTPPAYAKPNEGRHVWITNAFCKYGIGENAPDVAAIWYSDPDATAHAKGIGAPETIKSINIVDRELGRVIDSLKAKNLWSQYDLIISTDHGFVTEIGTETLGEFLIKEGLKKDKDSDDVILAGGALYLKDKSLSNIERIVSILQKQDWIGAIFTKSSKPGDMKGAAKGTLSYESVHWDHPGRTPEILVDENWSDSTNQFNFKGATLSKGIAGHGGSSPYEIDIPMIAHGPSFKKRTESTLATSNVDITPTVLFLQGISTPITMDGRVMNELFLTTHSPILPSRNERIKTTLTRDWGTYTLVLDRTIVGKKQYINYTKVNRAFKKSQ